MTSPNDDREGDQGFGDRLDTSLKRRTQFEAHLCLDERRPGKIINSYLKITAKLGKMVSPTETKESQVSCQKKAR